MRLDSYAGGDWTAAGIGRLAAQAEAAGLSGLWFAESKHSAFAPAAIAAASTESVQLGTGVAVAFARSPMVTAQAAWDLQQLSGGRFILGLGTQVRSHIERRFSMPYDKPASRMREYVAALRAIWRAFQGKARLDFAGDFYSFNLLTDAFNPGPIDDPEIPVFLAGVNPRMAGLAGEIGDGLHVHPFHTAEWLRQVLVPAVREARPGSDRAGLPFQIISSLFLTVGDDEADIVSQRAAVRRKLGFYASTPAYRPVLEFHDLGPVQEALNRCVRAGDLAGIDGLVTDEMLDLFAVFATWDTLADVIERRYGGIIDRVVPYSGSRLWDAGGANVERWRKVADRLKSPTPSLRGSE